MDSAVAVDVSVLLRAWSDGDSAAGERLVPLLYPQLRRRAAAFLRRERRDHTLQPTALVNEAYLRLVDQRGLEWQNRYNCGRGVPFSQLNVRVSKRFALPGGSRFELIGEVFNLFNALNPGGFSPRRLLGSAPNADFMQPTVFAGDFQQPEQRVGPVGVRWTFGR